MSTTAHDPGLETLASTPAPTTGHRLVDAALSEFGTLAEHPPAAHHAKIGAVAEVLAVVLENRLDGAQPRPPSGLPGPR